MPQKTRTFVAIELTGEVRRTAAALAAQLQPLAGDFRWVDEENLHYTLHFLGDLTDTEVVQVCDRVAAAAGEQAPFMLSAAGVGAFPSVERPRTIWIGAAQGAERVEALHASIGDELADLGFRGENRRFVPHLTLGRLGRQGRRASDTLVSELAALAEFEAGQLVVQQVTVFSSELRPDGPEYHVLSKAPLLG